MWSNVTDEQLVIITLALLVMYLIGCAIGASIRRAELAEADETIDRLDREVIRLSDLLLDSAVLECIEGSVDCGTEEEYFKPHGWGSCTNCGAVNTQVQPMGNNEFACQDCSQPVDAAMRRHPAYRTPVFVADTFDQLQAQLVAAGLPPLPDSHNQPLLPVDNVSPIFGDDCR